MRKEIIFSSTVRIFTFFGMVKVKVRHFVVWVENELKGLDS